MENLTKRQKFVLGVMSVNIDEKCQTKALKKMKADDVVPVHEVKDLEDEENLHYPIFKRDNVICTIRVGSRRKYNTIYNQMLHKILK